MIRVGRGNGETLEQSLEQAAENIRSPQLLLFFSKPGTLEQAATYFAHRYADIPTLGLCSVSVLHGGRVDTPDVFVISFEEGFQVACGLIRDLKDCPAQHIYRFEQDVKKISSGEKDCVCLEYCTGSEEMLVTTLNAVLDRYHVPLVGSTAFESIEKMGHAQVAFNGEVYGNSCIYAVIRCVGGEVRTYYENIYERTEWNVHQVTKADPRSRSVIEIDGRPAADVYCDVIQVPREKIIEMNMRYPFGRVLGTKIYVSDVAKVLPDGTLYCNKRLNPNDAITFLDYGRYRAIAMETIEKLQQENPHRFFTLTGDCIHRYWLYQDENFLEQHAENLSLLGEYAGNVCGGEQYHHQHINQSLVMVVFSRKPEEDAV